MLSLSGAKYINIKRIILGPTQVYASNLLKVYSSKLIKFTPVGSNQGLNFYFQHSGSELQKPESQQQPCCPSPTRHPGFVDERR